MSSTTESPAGNDVIRHIEDGVAWVTLNRPEAGNAMTSAMRDQISEWMNDASADLAVRVVVITRARSPSARELICAAGGPPHIPGPRVPPTPSWVMGRGQSATAGNGWWAPSWTARSQ
jgi:2-(1,2-epoxy-1,2-dihydrophenyl)acetyl-CoA isomerase